MGAFVAPIPQNMSFPFFDEIKEFNESTRREVSGSFVSLSGGITHYELGGPKDGRLIVLVHGFSVPYFIFDPLFDFLTTSGFRVLRYDLFGRGYSEKPRVRYDIHLFVRQLQDLLNTLELPVVSLLGLSMGGPITTAFIKENPGCVSKHILVDPAGGTRVELTRLLEMTKVPVLGELFIGLLGTEIMIKALASDFFDPNLVAIFQAKYKAQMEFKGFKQAILSTMRSGMLDSFFETYQKVGAFKIATLIIWGVDDTTTPYKDHRLILKALPHADFHPIEHCGHIPHYERPEIFNPILLEFLNR